MRRGASDKFLVETKEKQYFLSYFKITLVSLFECPNEKSSSPTKYVDI